MEILIAFKSSNRENTVNNSIYRNFHSKQLHASFLIRTVLFFCGRHLISNTKLYHVYRFIVEEYVQEV